MHPTADDATGQRLQQALGQWQHWQCDPPLSCRPVIEGVLTGGLSNHSWLVSSGGRYFVVRIDGVTPAQHGVNRQVEWRALQSASPLGIAPAPCYFNPELGALVVTYHTPDRSQAPATAALAGLLRQIHAMPRVHHRVDISERIRHYEQRILRISSTRYPAELERAIQSRLVNASQQGGTLVMTHNDLMPANLLHSEGHLLALDWEYCGMGSAWFDLAVASLGQDSQHLEPRALLEAYLSAAPSKDDLRTLGDFRAVARYLELLWHRSLAPAAQHAELMEHYKPMIERELH